MRSLPSPEDHGQLWWQRTLAVLATTLMLMTGPGIAQAAFTTKTGGRVTASTVDLSSLNADSVAVSCPGSGNNVNLKIQLTKPVERATKHVLTVKTMLFGFTVASYSGELNAGNLWTYQDQAYSSNVIRYAYEITASYDVKVNGRIVNTWVAQDPYAGNKSC